MALDPKKPVSLTLWESPEVRTRTPHTAASWLGAHVVRPLWLWRREVACVLVPVLVGAVPWVASGLGLGADALGRLGGGVVVSYLAVALVLLVPVVRARLARWVAVGRLRRRWDTACRHAGVESVSMRVPRIRTAVEVPAGNRLVVALPKGLSTEDVDSAADRLAVVLNVREVRVYRDPARARFPTVHILERDPFRDEFGPITIPSDLVDAESWALRDGVPVGVDEMGKRLSLGLVGRNLLIGGEPEAGKSVALGTVLAAAALDRSVPIYGLDAKQVEMALWEPVMERVVYNDIDEAIDLVRHLTGEMDTRYEVMKDLGVRSIPDTWPVTLLAIDELRFFTAHANRKSQAEFNSCLVDYVARGRAAGMPTVVGTQKPSNDVVPTSLRDLFAYRWALRCTTRDASDTILGSGWSTEGYTASVIDAADRGVGLLLAEGALPQWVKSAFVTDDDVSRIVQRSKSLRKEE